MSRAQVINLSYSKETGFQNSTMLPRTDEKIERLLIHPPFHVAIAGPFLRRKVEKLPIIDSFEHLSLGQRIRAFQILGFVAHAYIWGNEKTKEMNELPPQLARPLEKLGQEIGIAPLATYATTVLWNCSLKDTSKPWVPENVIVDTTFTNTDAEKKFYAISACIEVAGAGALDGLMEIASQISNKSQNCTSQKIESLFKQVQESLRKAVSLLSEVFSIDSNVFYWNIRPYFGGWSAVECNGKRGVHYKSVDHPGTYRTYDGISAAQSTLFQMLDILLSIRHDSDLLFEARKHMPGNHRAFLNEFQRMYKVKIADLTSSDLTTLKGYTACVLLLTEFRKKHRDAAVEKAVAVAYKAAKGKGLRRSFGLARHRTRTEPIGAGGSEIVPFLSKLITDTLDSKKGRIMKL